MYMLMSTHHAIIYIFMLSGSVAPTQATCTMCDTCSVRWGFGLH